MELLLKVYADQPPRLGIKYIYEYQAVRAYEELLTRAQQGELHAMLEIKGRQADLSITSEFNGQKFRYKDLEFKAADLQKLRALGEKPNLTFVHVFPQHNAILVAKPFRKATFLTITGLELRGAEFL